MNSDFSNDPRMTFALIKLEDLLKEQRDCRIQIFPTSPRIKMWC